MSLLKEYLKRDLVIKDLGKMIMNRKLKYRSLVAIYLVLLWIIVGNAMADGIAEANATEKKLKEKIERKAEAAEELKEKKEAAEKAKRERIAEAKRKAAAEAKAEGEMLIEQLDLPADTTPRLTMKELRISGNTLISTDELLKDVPLVYNASDKPLKQAESTYLYDFRSLRDVILIPGQPRQVSARTIEGFTQYLLSIYQRYNYAGIYVYVPAETISENQLQDDVLSIEVIEAAVSSVNVRLYEPNQVEVEKGYMRKSAILDWSPVKVGEVPNQKALDEFVNLLNLNPDRYVSAMVSRGVTPRSLSVEYDIYEANPWHWFIQVDNAGTKDRQWTPRIGLINTNLLGIDDTFTAVYQAPWDSGIDENYSIYGSYDFPLMGPRLRLNAYAGYSQFDVSPESGPTDFIGNGDFYGGILRYNVLQTDGWFFDIKGMLEHTRSKVTPTLFPLSTLGTDVKFWLWGWGLEAHRSDDMTRSSVGFDRWESWGGESGGQEFRNARTAAKSDFSIYSFYANHSQYLDPNKVGRLSGTFRWIGSNERLVPAKMTSFGGMYSVRGYDEYEVIADGGILASAQYEHDLVRQQQAKEGSRLQTQTGKRPFLRKLAPLAFFDYGRSTIKHPNPGGAALGEARHEELMSVGCGVVVELGDNFHGGVYYGYPLIDTPDTRTGKGRVNVSFMMRW